LRFVNESRTGSVSCSVSKPITSCTSWFSSNSLALSLSYPCFHLLCQVIGYFLIFGIGPSSLIFVTVLLTTSAHLAPSAADTQGELNTIYNSIPMKFISPAEKNPAPAGMKNSRTYNDSHWDDIRRWWYHQAPSPNAFRSKHKINTPRARGNVWSSTLVAYLIRLVPGQIGTCI